MKVALATPETVLYEGDATSLTAPGSEGYLQILDHHTPLICLLQQGRVTLVTPTQTLTYMITGGLLEVSHNTATLLADSLSS